MSGRYIAPKGRPPMHSVKGLALGVRFLRFGMPETAGGDEMYEHDQQDRSDDRDDKLAHQPKLGEVEQAEIADDKVGDNCSDYAYQQVAQNAVAPTTHGAARETSGDGAHNDLQR